MIINNNLNTFDHNIFQVIDSEEKAYWLGFIAADGCLKNYIRTDSGNEAFRVSFNINIKDYNHMLKFKSFIHLLKDLRIAHNQVRISLSSKKMFNDLVDKGLTPRKSLTLEPPKNVPEELIRHWIRGYFDGDGCIHKLKKGNYSFNVVGTKDVLNFIINKSDCILKVEKTHSKAFWIRSSSKFKKFLNYLYIDSNIKLERKFERYLEGLSYYN